MLIIKPPLPGLPMLIVEPALPILPALYILMEQLPLLPPLFSVLTPCIPPKESKKETMYIRSAKQDDIYGASNIVLPCPGSKIIFHLVKDIIIILKSSM
jgi:hypothetical protein